MIAANGYCAHVPEELYAPFFFIGLSIMDDIAKAEEAVNAFLMCAFHCVSERIEFSLYIREYTVEHELLNGRKFYIALYKALNMQELAQGAEARIYKDGKTVVKDRIPKAYRLKELDEKLRKLRTRRELAILERAANVIPVPKVIKSGKEEQEKKIVMEFLDGQKLASALDSLNSMQRREVCEKIGEHVAKLHNEGIIHGDLTTSNMILVKDAVYFIDFGLSFIDQKAEHKAVDVHVLKQALESKHHLYFQECFAAVLKGYEKVAKDAPVVLARLEKVEGRGHYKKK